MDIKQLLITLACISISAVTYAGDTKLTPTSKPQTYSPIQKKPTIVVKQQNSIADIQRPAQLKADLIPDNPSHNYNATIYYCEEAPGKKIQFRIKNIGPGTAGPSNYKVTFFIGNQQIHTRFNVPSLPSGQSHIAGQYKPPLGCFNPDCVFTIEVDSRKQVDETNENNNKANGLCIG